jgi:diguanylate cyclase (GGDEF)-like protein
MTFVGKIQQQAPDSSDESAQTGLAQRIDQLLEVRLSRLRMPADLKPLFERRVRRNHRKTTASWCGTAALLTILNGAFDFFLLPMRLIPLALTFRCILAGLLGAAGALSRRGRLARFAPGLIGLPCILSVAFAGAVGLMAHQPELLARYLGDSVLLIASAIIFVGLEMRFSVILAGASVPLIGTILLLSNLHPFAIRLQEIFSDGSTIGALLYGRRIQNLMQARLFLLNMRDELRSTEAQARHDELSSIAYTDPLTNIPNRRHFDELCAGLCGATPSLLPLSLCMIDIDHFKLLNDRLGHLEGDHCLRRIAAAIRNNLRSGADFAARYGGEEFLLLLPGTTAETAHDIAERLRLAIANLALPNPATALGIVTASIGIATLTEPPLTLHTLLQSADHALYRAKITGRNRVSM